MSDIPTYIPPAEQESTRDDSRDAILPPNFPSSTENTPGYGVTVPVPGATNDPADRGSSGYAPGAIPTTVQNPRYFDGDQAFIWVNGQKVSPSTLSPETIAAYQNQYVQAGLLNPGSYTPGFWDDKTTTANALLLEEANVSGFSASEVINRRLSSIDFSSPSSGGSGGGGGGSLPPTIRLSNSDDLKSAFRQAARQLHGGVFLEEDQLDGMVTAFQDQERSYQQRLVQGGGETEAPPSASAFAETSLEEQDPGAAQANRFQQMTQVLGQIVSG